MSRRMRISRAAAAVTRRMIAQRLAAVGPRRRRSWVLHSSSALKLPTTLAVCLDRGDNRGHRFRSDVVASSVWFNCRVVGRRCGRDCPQPFVYRRNSKLPTVCFLFESGGI